jgi:multidrug efflux system membrane fusion protein
MKAVLDNKQARLTPGQFLNVGMVLDKATGVVLVPNEAIQQGAEGNFLYVVKGDDTVEVRKLEIVASHQGMTAIGKGVTAGETVVTDGQLRLTPGATVKAKPAGGAATAAAAAPAK